MATPNSKVKIYSWMSSQGCLKTGKTLQSSSLGRFNESPKIVKRSKEAFKRNTTLTFNTKAQR
jgi:hypothetical protein